MVRRVTIDRTTAREDKEEHANFEVFTPFTDTIQHSGGGTYEFTVEHSVMAALGQYIDETVDQSANTFLSQLANDHLKLYQQTLDKPLVLTGGMACIPGLGDVVEERLSEALQHYVDVTAPADPVTAAARGAQRIAACFGSTLMTDLR